VQLRFFLLRVRHLAAQHLYICVVSMQYLKIMGLENLIFPRVGPAPEPSQALDRVVLFLREFRQSD
jgi:hypothetical protein